jgi:hypothetical protein
MLPASSRQCDARAAIRVKLHAAIDEGHGEQGISPAQFFQAEQMPPRVMAAFMRHQEIAIGPVAHRFFAADIDDAPAICVERGQSLGPDSAAYKGRDLAEWIMDS